MAGQRHLPYAAKAKAWLESQGWRVVKADRWDTHHGVAPYEEHGNWCDRQARALGAMLSHSRARGQFPISRLEIQGLTDGLARLAGVLTKPPGFTPGVTVDMMGIADFVAFPAKGSELTDPPPPAVVFVQATSKQDITSHILKYQKNKEVVADVLWWLDNSHRAFWIIGGWTEQVPTTTKKAKNRTKTKWRFEKRVLTAGDFEEATF